MRQVQAEGTRFLYLTKGEDINSLNESELTLSGSLPEETAAVLESNDVRLTVFERMLRRKQGGPYFLLWQDGRDLNEVDARVTEGSYTDADFAAALRTTYQETTCDDCGTASKSLVIPPGDPYPGAPGLQERKIASARFARCPRCRAAFRQMVVKTFGQR